MALQIFDRADPSRSRTQLKWFEQLREDYLRLPPGRPHVQLSRDKDQRAKDRREACLHEVRLPERGVAQLCRSCRKATRESIWMARCGPCGEFFSPVLWLATACEHCGGDQGALDRLQEHLDLLHSSARSA
jgi:hypothetical protein